MDITDRVLAEQEKARLQQQNLYLQEEIKAVHNFEEIIGRSPALHAVLDNVGRVAATDATVLISGETGTGKELIARAIHSNSRSRDKPLIKINCAALPAGLVESELFGHEKGAFTGAIARRIGRFELADRGTIFLDEIGELPLETQAKLLRVLQEREFDRVGGSAPIRVDVRVMAATNRDLLKAVREKRFARTLLSPQCFPDRSFRRCAIARRIFRSSCSSSSSSSRRGSASASTASTTRRCERLTAYSWPGNVRELENIIERAVILATGPTLELAPDILGGFVPETAAAGAATRPRRCRARAHPERACEDGLGDRRAEGRGHSLGSPPQHPSQPAQEAGDRTRSPRALVASHDIS